MPFPCFTHQATLLILCVIVLSTKGGPVLAENEHSLRQLLQGDTVDATCRNPENYLCDCEVVPRRVYREILYVFQREEVNCEPLCGEAATTPNCESSCDTLLCVAQYGDYCSVEISRIEVNSIRLMSCEFSRRLQMNICTRRGFRMSVDVPTLDAVKNGSCVPACGVDVEGLRCHFNARLFGEPFIPDEVEMSVEAPESEPEAPPSAMASYPDYEPVGEPSMEEYEIPASESSEEVEYSVPEPSMEEYYSIPEPSLEEYYSVPEPSLEEYYSVPEPSLEEYSIAEPSVDDYFEPSMEAPESLPELAEVYTVDIPIRLVDRDTSENEIYESSWSNCSQHCAQAPRNGTRERTVVCRNLFGFPLPPSECLASSEYRRIEACELVNCVGPYFYVLGEWSTCSQECSTFDTDSETMSVGERRRALQCFESNGNSTAVENCLQQLANLEFLTEACGENPCSPVRYRVSPWSECSCVNGSNTRTRSVECVDNDNISVLEAMCRALEIQPPSRRQDCTPVDC